MQTLKSTQKHKDVADVILLAERAGTDKKIILDPPYQRNVVWDDERKAGFINSLLKGINSHHLIFNMDEQNNCICMDGKQRITAIVEFSHNKFPVNYDNVSYYYNEIPEDNKIKDAKILPQVDKGNFERFPLPTDEYVNLSYEDQVDIFTRIQKGIMLTKGELISSQLVNDSVTHGFNKYCDRVENLFRKFVNDKGVLRKEHHDIIIKLMNMVSKNILKRPTTKQNEEYIKSIKTVNKLNEELNKVDSLIKFCFGADILGHESITTKLPIGFIIVLCIGISKLHNGDTSKCNKQILVSSIRKLYREIKSSILILNEKKIEVSKNTIDNTEKIIARLKSYYNNITKKSIEMSNDGENEDHSNEENNEENSEGNASEGNSKQESEDSEEVIQRKKPPIIKPATKPIIKPVNKPIIKKPIAKSKK